MLWFRETQLSDLLCENIPFIKQFLLGHICFNCSQLMKQNYNLREKDSTFFVNLKAGICTNQVEIIGESQSEHIFYLLSGPHAHVLKTNIFGYRPSQPLPKHISCSVLTYAARELCVRFSTSCLHFRCCR